MPDHATSSDPTVQRQLDRLAALGPGRDVLGLERISALCARLGNPQDELPPVFHVAGTNGKGSVCAFLRAMLEADGKTAHVYSSPHLVRFNERTRLAGTLIDDGLLAGLLEEVLDAADGLSPSFFEVTTAAAFLAFARTPADAAIVEVGLGGRLDATNVITAPAVCGIATIGIDHEAFLLAPEDGTPDDPIARIGWEKAGITKANVPIVLQSNAPPAMAAMVSAAELLDAPLFARGSEWEARVAQNQILYRDANGALDLPLPTLPGVHQADNAALAVAMLRHQDSVSVSKDAMAAGIENARWPARLQKLSSGPLTGRRNTEIWLDGGHNHDAGAALGAFFEQRGKRLHIVIGMLTNKHADSVLKPLSTLADSVSVVPVPGHHCHDASAFRQAMPALSDRIGEAANVADSLAALPDDGTPVLICGSLYLAGEVLRENLQPPE